VVDVVNYSNQFLPHVIRLFCPGDIRIDGKLDFFRQTFALYQPGPEESCLLAKGSDGLLACVYLVSFEKVQPGLIFIKLAVDRKMGEEDFTEFWEQCLALARTLAKGQLMLRVEVTGNHVVNFLAAKGLKVSREMQELYASLDQLPQEPNAGDGDFKVVSLAQQPDLEALWLNTFNQGSNTPWDIPPLDSGCLDRMRQESVFDADTFWVGFSGGEAVVAQFYSIADKNEGVVRIYMSSPRSRAFGRRMLKETLSALEQKGFSKAILYADAASQATNLLYKMLGFLPQGKKMLMECLLPARP
jgi:hypothetical protein